jgi:choline dehydrogenase-like flavoprotein
MKTKKPPLPTNKKSYDTIVVGSGPGGATVARELVKQGQNVAILEWGDNTPLKGELMQMAKIAGIPSRGAFFHSDLSLLMRGITVGGTSTINFATAMPPPQPLFARYGIDLSAEVAAIRAQLPINVLPDDLIGPMAHSIKKSADSLGLQWQKLEKFIAIDTCRSECHRCTYGCPYGAKWTTRYFIEEAVQGGATLITGAKVTSILTAQRVTGVQYKQGVSYKKLYANRVVLAAGGIGSPRILDATGIKNVGKAYFVDPVVAVMGSVKGKAYSGREIPMAMGMHLPDKGIMLSDLTLPKPLFQLFSAQVGRLTTLASHAKTLTIMVKIRDELGGRIGKHWLNKKLVAADHDKLNTGIVIAKDILQQANATSLYQSHHFAAHPGGSVKIGECVDANLESEIKGLYVCDASVIPEPWGLAPSYTLMCLGMRLAKHLN